MVIKSLTKMENLVEKNKTLFWDGWDVLYRTPSPAAWADPNGIFYKGKWYLQKRYTLTASGWEIPDRLVR